MNNDLIYFVNSKGRTTYLATPNNRNYFVLAGRYGFTAPEVDVFTQKFVSGKTEYFGKALRPRNCGLQMLVRGKDQAERDKIFNDMLDVLLDADGEGEGRLYVKRSDGSLVYLNCVYSSGMRVSDQYKNFRTFEVGFYAADPWFYATKTVDIYDYGQGSFNDLTINWQAADEYWFEMDYKFGGIQTDTAFDAGVTVSNFGATTVHLWTEDMTAGTELIINTRDGVSYVQDTYGKKTFYSYLNKLIVPAGASHQITPERGSDSAIWDAFEGSTYSIVSRIAGV